MMEASGQKEYVVRNCLTYAYVALRSKERLMGNSTTSFYENYFQQLADALSPGKKLDVSVSNSEVESFYLGRVSLGEFRLHNQKRIFSKVSGWEFAPFSSIVWNECYSMPDKTQLCAKIDIGIARQIWEMFLWLDIDSQSKIHVEDICDFILRILRENGHSESEQNIREWFCNEVLVDFWSFFAAIVENYSGLLKPYIIKMMHELITTEILLSGKLTKKGHKIHSWKERWFALQPTQLSYFESQESMTLKGTISIGVGSQFEFLPDSKGHQRKFCVLDSQTQVPYEICTPDADALQRWNYGIKVAIAMNKVSGTNFLHKLSLAQKQVFPENTMFSVSAITPSVMPAPSAKMHRQLAGSKSVPVDNADEQRLNSKSPPPPVPAPYQNKSDSQLPHQKSFPTSTQREPDSNLDDPPPVPPQRYLGNPSVTPRPKSRGATASDLEVQDSKARRRHSSIIGQSEWDREIEKEREKVSHVDVGDVTYAVVSKEKSRKRSLPGSPNRVASPPVPPAKDVLAGKQVRRIQPKTPSPTDQRKGYVQLEFQNGMSNLKSANSTPAPEPQQLPRDVRTKWGYSTVVFDKDAQKEKEFEFAETTKKNKPLPPPPGRKTTSDSSILAPQPVPRNKKPESLTDLNKGSDPRGLEYAAIDFTSAANTPPQNGARKPPSLPLKEDSVESLKQDTPTPRPRPTPRQRVVTPATETPPPIPARRGPGTPT